jgi:hypothetical protein
MVEIPVQIDLPMLWSSGPFTRTSWGTVNFLVGPNGTGKSLFADQLRRSCESRGLRPRYLNAERLAGLEKQAYGNFGFTQLQQGYHIGQFADYKNNARVYGLSSDSFVLLKEKLDLRVRVEATLSQLFGRRLRLVEEGGYMKPKVQSALSGRDYDVREDECHGIKELLSLLTYLYDDDNNCLILDEPELHLHPQYQTLLMQEIRKLSGDPLNGEEGKIFFVITHSPYFIDIRSLDDLQNVIVFQPDRGPKYIDALDPYDAETITRLLAKINVHHKQFFFATNPVFVEGYTDQNIFNVINLKLDKYIAASGTSIIDVGGKEEVDVFYRLARKLGISSSAIVDLDVLVGGRLRRSLSSDIACRSFVQSRFGARDLMDMIGKLEKQADDLISTICSQEEVIKSSEFGIDLMVRIDKLKKSSDPNRSQRLRYIALVCVDRYRDDPSVSEALGQSLTMCTTTLNSILEVMTNSRVHVLRKGELENYLPSYKGNPYNVADDAKYPTFVSEIDSLNSPGMNRPDVIARYPDLIDVLDSSSPNVYIDLDLYLGYVIGDWINKVQFATERGELSSMEQIENLGSLDWLIYKRILEVISFDKSEDGFRCTVRLRSNMDPDARQFTFTAATVPARFRLPVKGQSGASSL